MSEINKSKVTLEMIETNTKTAEISVEEIFDIIFDNLYDVLDDYIIYSEKPSIDYADNGDSMEVFIEGIDNYRDSSDIIQDTRQKSDSALEAFINDYIKEKAEESEEKKTAAKKQVEESGEITL